MSNNTQLPAEVVKELADKANGYAHGKVGDIQTIPANLVRPWECAADGWEAGATLYASKWFQTFEENGRLASKIADYVEKEKEYIMKLHAVDNALAAYKKEYQVNSDLLDNAINILEKVKSQHEAGLLPDRLLYNKIKTFLDGKK